jgi:hypothetical protein
MGLIWQDDVHITLIFFKKYRILGGWGKIPPAFIFQHIRDSLSSTTIRGSMVMCPAESEGSAKRKAPVFRGPSTSTLFRAVLTTGCPGANHTSLGRIGVGTGRTRAGEETIVKDGNLLRFPRSP